MVRPTLEDRVADLEQRFDALMEQVALLGGALRHATTDAEREARIAELETLMRDRRARRAP